MSNNKRLKVGNKLIEQGKVHRIFKITEKKIDGKKVRIIHFKPYFKNAINNSLVCSIPEPSIKDTNLRSLVSKDDVKVVLAKLAKRSKRTKPIDNNEAGDILKLNNIKKTVQLARKFWSEKNNEDINFTKRKKDILEDSIMCIAQEIACVLNIPLNKAEEKINSALQSS